MPRGRRGRPGLVGTMARTAVVAGTATAVVGHSQNKQAAKQADAQQDLAQQQQIADMQAQLDQQAQQAAIDAAVAEQVAAAQAAPPPPPPAAPAAGGSDMMADLQKLADMKAQGLLTDEEFASMKAKLLA
jgi:Short C-terminal domain